MERKNAANSSSRVEQGNADDPLHELDWKSLARKRGALTGAGRKRLSDAMKKRWAEKKRNAS
jgi:hypothetical protein